MCKIAVRLWMQTFNLAEALLGLGMAGYGGYLAVKAPSSFSDFLAASGGIMFIVAMLGCCSVGGRRSCGLSLYGMLLFLLATSHAALAAVCFFAKQKVLDWVSKHSNDEEKTQKIRDFIHEHIKILSFIFLGLFVLELVNLLLACFARNTILDDEEDTDIQRSSFFGKNKKTETERENLLDARSTPRTNKQREALNQKYGNKFQKNRVEFV